MPRLCRNDAGPIFTREGLIAAFVATTLLLGQATPATAQEDPPAPPPPAANPPKDDAVTEAEEKKILEGSNEFVIQTIDGVYLNTRLWVAKGSGKETPIIILLHMRGKSQRDLFPFAKFLSDNGYAVCTFDFRGHGLSRDVDPDVYVKPSEAIKADEMKNKTIKEKVVPQGSRPKPKEAGAPKPKEKKKTQKIDQAEEFRSGKEIVFCLTRDLQTVKEYLITKHNEGVCNIRRLGIVACGEMSSSIVVDWMNRNEFRVGRQQGWQSTGGDLAGLVLMNPRLSYEGYKLPTTFAEAEATLPVMIVSGNEKKEVDEVGRISRKMRVPIKRLKGASEEEKKEKENKKDRAMSGWFQLESKLTGSELLRPPVQEIDSYIGGFLKQALTTDKKRNWEAREAAPDRGGFGSG